MYGQLSRRYAGRTASDRIEVLFAGCGLSLPRVKKCKLFGKCEWLSKAWFISLIADGWFSMFCMTREE